MAGENKSNLSISWHNFQGMSGLIFFDNLSTSSSEKVFLGDLLSTTPNPVSVGVQPLDFEHAVSLSDRNETSAKAYKGLEDSDNWELYGFLSLLFPIGLALYRSGLAQRKNSILILATPFIHISVGCLMYWLIGYGFANGDSDVGFIGTKSFVPRSHLLSSSRNISVNNWFSQFCVVVSCNAIAGAGLPESSYLVNQIIVSFVVSGFAFPVVAHWTHFPVGWLKMQKFTDFAGAGVLHIVGGSCALVVIVLGRARRVSVVNRERKFSLGNRYLSATNKDITKFFTSLQDLLETSKVLTSGHNPVLSTFGAFLSIVGFFALQLVFKNFDQNGSNLFGSSSPNEVIILNTFLSSSTGALTSCFVTRIITHQWSIYRLFGGAVSGLVLASAGLDVYLSWASLILGFCGGMAYIAVRNLVLKLRVNDPAEVLSVFLVPGILSILSRGVATSCLENDPKIFLWHWAGVSVIFTWSASLILIPFIPISFCLTRTLFVQDDEEQAKEGLDKVYMREIVISHFCNPTIINSNTIGGKDRNRSDLDLSKSRLDLDLSKSRLVLANPEPSPVLVHHEAPTRAAPNYFAPLTQASPESDNHPEITSPILMSTTASMPSNMLKSIELLHKLKAEKIEAQSSSAVVENFQRSHDSIPKSGSSTPRGQHRPAISQTLPTPETLYNLNKKNVQQEKQRRTGAKQLITTPHELLRHKQKEQTASAAVKAAAFDPSFQTPVRSRPPTLGSTERKSRPKINLVEDDYTSGDSDTNNNSNRKRI